MAFTWDNNWTADTVLNGTTTVTPNGSAIGSLIILSGKSATTVCVDIAGQGGVDFDKTRVYIGLIRDLDGTNCEPPPGVGDNQADYPLVPLNDPSNLGVPRRFLHVRSTFGSAVRPYVKNLSGVPILPTIQFKQC